MTLTELSVALGIDIPAERFAAYSPIPDGRRDALCTPSLIERLLEGGYIYETPGVIIY